MRYVVVGFCLIAAACSAAPTSPASLSAAIAPSSSSDALATVTMTAASSRATEAGSIEKGKSGSGVPFKGRLEAIETVEGNVHHLAGAGHATHLGRFTYAATITVDNTTGDGAGHVVWTAADGDQLFSDTKGVIVTISDTGLTLAEQQVITGGTGRFKGASGTIEVERTLDFATGSTAGSFTGRIDLRH
ncbi:MAG: hypothetical protein ABI603_01140 [Acidobacteriota bacterium]